MLIGSCKSALLSPSPVFEVQDTLSNEQVLAVLLVVEEADFEIRPKPRSRRARRRSARGYGLRRLRVMLDISRKGFWGYQVSYTTKMVGSILLTIVSL